MRILLFLMRLFFTPGGFVVGGLLLLGLGATMIWQGAYGKLLEPEELTQITGVVSKAVEHRGRYGAKRQYELIVVTKDGRNVNLALPDGKISKEQAASLIGQPVAALMSNEGYNDVWDLNHSEVWELTSGDTTLFNYATTRWLEAKKLADAAKVGPYVAGVGAIVMVTGIFRVKRRRKLAAGIKASAPRRAV